MLIRQYCQLCYSTAGKAYRGKPLNTHVALPVVVVTILLSAREEGADVVC